MKKVKVLFLDRDGTINNETTDEQIDSFEKLSFVPNAIYYLGRIVRELDYQLVMVTNQDGLGTNKFPEETFWPVQNFIIETLKGEGITFQDILIDRSFPEENKPTRKPGVGMFNAYLNNKQYDLANSFVVGDRLTDMKLAENLGSKGIWINNGANLGNTEINDKAIDLASTITLSTNSWEDIYKYLKTLPRIVKTKRTTKETDINVELNLEGNGVSSINTGLSFFDHMLEQISKHGEIDLVLSVNGDLHVDEHHTIEDVGITLGEAFNNAIGNKIGMERYGFCLPMDDCLAQVAIDFGGRNWLEWDAEFKREKIGDMPSEMFKHFFKSFSDSAKCNLNIKAEGENEHHKIESIFKCFAKAIRMAIQRNINSDILPSTKGVL